MKTATLCAMVCFLVGPAGAAEEAQVLNRGFARVRPYVGVTRAGFEGEQLPARPAGAIADLGVEAATRSGFLIGFEFAPLTLGAARPQMTGRLQLGYASEQIA